MGIYPNHGVEYWIEIDKSFDNIKLKKIIEKIIIDTNFNMYVTPSNCISVLSTSRTDDRLVNSNYFKERKDEWFNDQTCYREWRDKINDQSLIDIEITQREWSIINKIKKDVGDYITYEGWFDVNTIGYSY